MRVNRFSLHAPVRRSVGGARLLGLAFAFGRAAGFLLVLVALSGEREAIAQDVLLAIDGTTGDQVRRVASISDVDGDGVRDLVVGAANNHPKVRLHSGLTGAELLEIVGPQRSSLGFSVDAAGDFDDDGIPDFVVGSPNDNAAGTASGAVQVYSSANGDLLAAMYGEFFEEKFGYEVAGLGDLDQDGYDDIGAGSKYHRQVRIYGGPDGHLIRQHAMGDSGHGWRRPSIASIGDVDIDGVPDYVVGWPTDSTAGGWTGTVVVFSRRGGTAIHEVHGPTPNGGGLIGSHLGLSVAGVGDLDGDGIPDFAAGAPGNVEPGISPPPTQAMVRAYSGQDAHILHEWIGAEYTNAPTGRYFGFHVAGGGDLNGGGVPDILVGAPNDGGTNRGTVSVFPGSTGERLWRILGSDGAGGMYYCAILGDMDGDGLIDFATGDGSSDAAGNNSGRITVYAGSPGDLERHCFGDSISSNRVMRLEMSGALGIGNNFLSLYTSEAVSGGIALFFYGPVSQSLPFGGGWLCTGPPSYFLAPPLPVDSSGFVEHALDFTQLPLSDGPSQVLPGSTWSFQLYCRNPHPSGTGPLLSDGLLITFPP